MMMAKDKENEQWASSQKKEMIRKTSLEI